MKKMVRLLVALTLFGSGIYAARGDCCFRVMRHVFCVRMPKKCDRQHVSRYLRPVQRVVTPEQQVDDNQSHTRYLSYVALRDQGKSDQEAAEELNLSSYDQFIFERAYAISQ